MMPQEIIFARTGEAAGYTCRVCGRVHSIKYQSAKGVWAKASDCCKPRLCGCGAPVMRYYTVCAACRDRNELERLAKKQRVDWDGDCWVACGDDLYNDLDEAIEDGAVYVHPCEFKPVRIDIDYVWDSAVGDHPEECDISGPLWDDVVKAVEVFNAGTKQGSWWPSEKQIIVLDEDKFAAMLEGGWRMRIASHHLPGIWRHDPNFSPRMPWPENCTVQWRVKLTIRFPGKDSPDAFFEAFPNDNAGGFIRGEGRTCGEAELNAFAQYMRQASCREHVWCRRGRKNGLGICPKCGALFMGNRADAA